jgi:hypothetical protein
VSNSRSIRDLPIQYDPGAVVLVVSGLAMLAQAIVG